MDLLLPRSRTNKELYRTPIPLLLPHVLRLYRVKQKEGTQLEKKKSRYCNMASALRIVDLVHSHTCIWRYTCTLLYVVRFFVIPNRLDPTIKLRHTPGPVFHMCRIHREIKLAFGVQTSNFQLIEEARPFSGSDLADVFKQGVFIANF